MSDVAVLPVNRDRGTMASPLRKWYCVHLEEFMQIKFVSVMVHDQDAALRFYTSVLGFEKMADLPLEQFRWLTVTSPEGAISRGSMRRLL